MGSGLAMGSAMDSDLATDSGLGLHLTHTFRPQNGILPYIYIHIFFQQYMPAEAYDSLPLLNSHHHLNTTSPKDQE